MQQSNDAALGGFLVPGQFRGDLFIDTLRAKLVTARLGRHGPERPERASRDPEAHRDRRRRSGSPKISAIDLSDPGFGQISMTPRTVGARTELTRNLLMQSSPGRRAADAQRFRQRHRRGDRRGRHQRQSGIGAVPKGLLQHAGIGSFNLATVNWANLMAAVEDIQTANADEGRAGLGHQPACGQDPADHAEDHRRHRQQHDHDRARPRSPATRWCRSTIVPANVGAGSTKSALIFGNWSDLLIGYWGSFDLLVNPYESTAYAKGNVQVRAMLNTDVNVRQLLSFTAAIDIV